MDRVAKYLFVVIIAIAGLTLPALGDENAKLVQSAADRADATKVAFIDSEPQSPITMIAKPLFRYSDQPRRILDGTFWCWESEGRPVAFQKIELYSSEDNGSPQWFYCFASASTKRIETIWDVGESWKAKKPGVTLTKFEAGPKPAAGLRRIGLQSKQIAQQFTVRIADIGMNTEEQLRLLPRPIHQYGTAASVSQKITKERSLTHGAVYNFASNGTNPDALLLVELHGNETTYEWKCGWIQMTSGQLDATWKNGSAWHAPYRPYSAVRPCKFDRWLFFLESVAGR